MEILFTPDQKLVEVVGGNIEFGKPLGRPVDPNSPRQQALAELAERREKGLVKRGRPKGTVNRNSKRQQQIIEMKAKKALGLGKPGRPKVVKEVVEEVVVGEGK